MPRKVAQFVSKDEVFPIAYKRDGTARVALNLYYNNPDFVKFLYSFARYLPGINYIARLIFAPVWVAWEIWQRKARKSAPSSPEEDLAVDPRLARLIRAVASVVSDGRVPEEVALRGMALNLALLKSMEDGTLHELHSKASRVYAMAEVYHKYLRGEIGDEELIANLGSVQLSVLARAPSPPPSQSIGQNNSEKRVAKHLGEDGVFAKVLAGLMFSAAMPKRGEDH
jgi:hypothetical protein